MLKASFSEAISASQILVGLGECRFKGCLAHRRYSGLVSCYRRSMTFCQPIYYPQRPAALIRCRSRSAQLVAIRVGEET